MKDATLANLRKSSDFFKTDEIIRIFDGRKREEIGFFVPRSMREEFDSFLRTIEEKRKARLLQRVAKAQAKDPVEEGGCADGL